MNPVGILGGTFDPIHNGHLITARALLEKRNLEKIIFVPCYLSPHKQDITSSDSAHRIEMLKLAIDDIADFEMSDFEIVNKGISYTLNTIMEMRKEYNDIELIIGYDNLISFDTWRQPDQLLELCKLVVMKRNTDQINESRHKYFDLAEYVDTPTIEISASEIRERVINNLPIDNLVPEKVKEYISINHLYK